MGGLSGQLAIDQLRKNQQIQKIYTDLGLPPDKLKTFTPDTSVITDENGKIISRVLDVTLPQELDFSQNQWTGYLTNKDFDYNGNILTLGAAPPEYSQIEAILLIALLNRASKTPEGQKQVFQLMHKYLDSITKVLDGLHFTSAANPYNNMINEYVAQPLYMRLGLISPRDATQNRAWLDHIMGEMLKRDYFKDSITGLTSMVTGLERQIPTILGGAQKE